MNKHEMISPAGETLDPVDWSSAARLAHDMVDFAVAEISNIRDRPVWQPMPEDVRRSFSAPLPRAPEPDFVGWQAPNRFLVGYGLDHAGARRGLPDVCALD